MKIELSSEFGLFIDLEYIKRIKDRYYIVNDSLSGNEEDEEQTHLNKAKCSATWIPKNKDRAYPTLKLPYYQIK